MPVIFDPGDQPDALNPLLPVSAGAIRYVDLTAGDNHNDGLTPSTPWRTVDLWDYGPSGDEFGGRDGIPPLPGQRFYVAGIEDQNECELGGHLGAAGTAAQPITIQRWPGRPRPVWREEFRLGERDDSARVDGYFRLIDLQYGDDDRGSQVIIACTGVDVLGCRFHDPDHDPALAIYAPSLLVSVAGCLFALSAYGDGSLAACIAVLGEAPTGEAAIPTDVSIYNNVCVGPCLEFVAVECADRFAVVFNSVHKAGADASPFFGPTEAVRLGPRAVAPSEGDEFPRTDCLVLWNQLNEDTGAVEDSSGFNRDSVFVPGAEGSYTRSVGEIVLAPAMTMPQWGTGFAGIRNRTDLEPWIYNDVVGVVYPWMDVRPGFPVDCDLTGAGDRSWTILLDLDWNADPGPDDLSPPGDGILDMFGKTNLRGIWGTLSAGALQSHFGFAMWYDAVDGHAYFGSPQECAPYPEQKWIVDDLQGPMSFHYNADTEELTICADGVPVVGPMPLTIPALWAGRRISVGLVDWRISAGGAEDLPPHAQRGGLLFANVTFRGIAVWECYLPPEDLVGVRP